MRLIAALLTLLATPALAATGFRHLTIPDPGNPPIQADFWYPTTATPHDETLSLHHQTVADDAPIAGTHLPLILISHGAGGGAANHGDTATALADAGFAVLALTHTGDNLKDHSRALEIQDRPRQLHVALDYMLGAWPDHASIDPARIGAFGFSAGGFSVLVASGGQPDLSKIAPFCQDHTADWTCGMIAKFRPAGAPPPQAIPPSAWVHDARIRAAVVAAPALGYTFGKSGLAGVHIPVQLWRAADDHILPQPGYAQAVADDLPTKPEYHVVAGADHMDFLSACAPDLAQYAPMVCNSEAGFDRAAFHANFNRDVVAFLTKNVRNAPGQGSTSNTTNSESKP